MTDLQKFKIFAIEMKDLFDKYMLIQTAPIEFKNNEHVFQLNIYDDNVSISCMDDGHQENFECDELPKVSFSDVYDYDSNCDFDPLNL